MLSINERISLRQLQALIIVSAMGTGVIVLPRRVAEYAGSDGWIIVLGLTAIAMIIGALVSTAARLRPKDSFVQSTGFYLSRPVACLLGALLWLKLVFVAGLELRTFMLIVREILLQQTPLLVTGATMLIISAYAAVKGIETRARVAEVLLALMVLPFLFFVIVAVLEIDWSNLQPVFVTPPKTLVQGSLRLGFLFAGLECILLVSPYIEPKKKLRKAVVSALGFAGIIVAIVTVLTLAKFGRGVVDLPWPVLRMMDMLNLPGAFTERQEALMFSFWIITTFAFINALLFFGGVLIKDLAGIQTPKNSRPHGPTRANRPWQLGVLITAVAIFIVTLIPWNETDIYNRLDFVYLTLGLFYMVVLPLVLILVSRFKKQAAMLAIVALSLTALSGCWDKIEIENRAFVVAIGVDKADEPDARFTVTLSLPAIEVQDDDAEGAPPHIKTASAKTVTEAIKIINAETDTQLYFGQTKMLVLGEDLLSETDLVKSTVDAFNRKPELDRAMHVLAAHGRAADILTSEPPGGSLPGTYISAIYRDKHKIGGTSFNMNMEHLVMQMKYSGTVLIPALAASEEKLSLSGAALMVNAGVIGMLDADELKGYLWGVDKGGLGAIISPDMDGEPIPFKVETHRAKLRFAQRGENLEAHLDIELTGRVEECPYGNARLEREGYRQRIEEIVAKKVKDEILDTSNKVQREFGVDGFHWLETMRKKQYALYLEYVHWWDEVFPEVQLVPQVKVKLRAG